MEAERIERPSTVAYAFTCADCGDRVIHAVRDRLTTGYAHTRDGKLICFRCCGKRDRQAMIETGHSRNLPLYLSQNRAGKGGWHVGNWPGTLKIPVTYLRQNLNGHNWGLTRIDIWFNGPDGHVWHGYQLGGNTQIVHCKRTKELVKTYHSPEYHQNA